MYTRAMRTTVNLDDDVAAAVERARSERGTGLSETVNDLIRAGLVAKKPSKPFVQKGYPLGLKIDIRNIGEALELIEGPDYR